jgi:hypothetical protein
MPGKAPRSCPAAGSPHPDTHPIQVWETQHPGRWILLEITEEDEGEPVCGRLLATAENLDALQAVWKSYRDQGLLTMLTYGPPREPRPEVVVSAT